MQKLALSRGSNWMHLEEDSHTPLIFIFTPSPGKRFSKKTWSENSTQDRIMTLRQCAFPQVESLYLLKENTVGQMNSPYCICSILYFAMSRRSWRLFLENSHLLGKGHPKCSAIDGWVPYAPDRILTDPQKKHQCHCDWKQSVLSYSARKNHHQQRAQEKNIDISGPWPTRSSWEKSIRL